MGKTWLESERDMEDPVMGGKRLWIQIVRCGGVGAERERMRL